jgi:tetratricopeptide (TPR) repeat protein
VAEPFLDATVRPNILFPAYLSGFNLAEAFYLAMPFVSWQTVVVGDPLCAPFPRKVLQPSEIDAGVDPFTGLPALFSARRLRVAAARGVRMDAARLVVRAEVLSAKDDKAGARAALEEATALEPRMLAAQMALARDYELSRDYDKAIERYRLALRVNADDAIALNNLAYLMAVQKHLPADAVGYAERANQLSPGNPAIADTMAWIQHLLGRNYEAAPIMTGVVKAEPANADFRLHAAVIYAAIGKLDEAAAELKEALRLDPSLATNDEVKTLRTKLSGR